MWKIKLLPDILGIFPNIEYVLHEKSSFSIILFAHGTPFAISLRCSHGHVHIYFIRFMSRYVHGKSTRLMKEEQHKSLHKTENKIHITCLCISLQFCSTRDYCTFVMPTSVRLYVLQCLNSGTSGTFK